MAVLVAVLLLAAGPAAATDAAAGGPRALEERAAALVAAGSAESLAEASRLYAAAAELWRAAGDDAAVARTLLAGAGVDRSRGELAAALDGFLAAAESARRAGDAAQEALAWTNAGGTASDLGDQALARSYYQRAVAPAAAADDPLAEAMLLHNLAAAHERLGEYQEALERYQEVLPKVRALGSLPGESAVLNNLATVYFDLGDYRRALATYEQVLPLRRRMGDTAGEARTLSHVGLSAHRLGDHAAALERYDEALALHRRTGDRLGEANTLVGVGEVLLDAGDWAAAGERFAAALAIARPAGARRIEATAAEGSGRAAAGAGDLEAALAAHREALALRREIGHRRGVADSLSHVAGLERRRGDLAAARRAAEEAMAVVESLRGAVTRDELRTSFFASRQDLYAFVIDLAMEQHRAEPAAGHAAAALAVAERAKARGLLDLLEEAGADLRQGVDPELLAREAALVAEIERVEVRRTRALAGEGEDDDVTALDAELSALLADHEALLGTLRASSPRYAALALPAPLGLDGIRRQVLDPGTLLLEYALGEERSHLWVVGTETFAAYELPPRREIEAAVRDLYAALTARNREDGGGGAPAVGRQEAAARLADQVLAPAAGRLAGHRLVVVPDGALHYVPFAVLPEPRPDGGAGEPLVVGHELVHLPSASVLAEVRREAAERAPAPRTLALLADPVFQVADPRVANGDATRSVPTAEMGWRRLRFSALEAEAIAALVPAEERFLASGLAATRRALLDDGLGDYRYLHLATHALVDDAEPGRTGLVFSLVDGDGEPRNGFVRLHDVYGLDLNAELVTLSACETALGREIRGEGMVGLTRGFMYAGAERVLASLWSVQDRATAELMRRFYRGVLAEGATPAAALRAAQVSMLAERRWADPYLWAPFVLQGDWR